MKLIQPFDLGGLVQGGRWPSGCPYLSRCTLNELLALTYHSHIKMRFYWNLSFESQIGKSLRYVNQIFASDQLRWFWKRCARFEIGRQVGWLWWYEPQQFGEGKLRVAREIVGGIRRPECLQYTVRRWVFIWSPFDGIIKWCQATACAMSQVRGLHAIRVWRVLVLQGYEKVWWAWEDEADVYQSSMSCSTSVLLSSMLCNLCWISNNYVSLPLDTPFECMIYENVEKFAKLLAFLITWWSSLCEPNPASCFQLCEA